MRWRMSSEGLPPTEESACVQAKIEAAQLDLTDLASVKQFAEGLDKVEQIDSLVLNAGVMACPQEYTKHGFEMQIGEPSFRI